MNVKRYLAENSRLALRSVKQELGEDAVILSSRQVPGGFEMVAIAQAEMSSITSRGAGASAEKPREPAAASSPGGQSLVDFALSRGAQSGERVDAPPVRRLEPELQPLAMPAPAPARGARAPIPPAAIAPAPAAPAPGASAPCSPASSLPAPDLAAELKSMRTLLEGQLARLAWNDAARRAPLRTKLAARLLGAGFSPRLARAATARLPDDFSEAQAGRWLFSLLEANLRCAPADELITRGGIYALIGPTGVGKTTTTAKLAARFVMNHGAAGLGLVSTDSYRIGAQDQLRIYGRILGVPVHTVQDAAELHAALAALHEKKLVLIDTIGVSQRDQRVAEQATLLGGERIRRILLLNAASHPETLDDVASAYRGEGIHGCCLTKVDEAVKLGGALDCAMRHRLMLHYVSNGQRVPEDLHLPVLADLLQESMSAPTGASFTLEGDEAQLLLAPMSGNAAPC